jgi:hypothetical protein
VKIVPAHTFPLNARSASQAEATQSKKIAQNTETTELSRTNQNTITQAHGASRRSTKKSMTARQPTMMLQESLFSLLMPSKPTTKSPSSSEKHFVRFTDTVLGSITRVLYASPFTPNTSNTLLEHHLARCSLNPAHEHIDDGTEFLQRPAL